MPDFRSLISRMADELDHYRQLLMDDRRETHALATEARAALVQPEPEGPSDEDVEAAAQRIYEAMRFERVEATPVWSENGNSFAQDAAREAARAVLARWGRPAPQPVPVSERWPEFSDCDNAERVWCWSWAIGTWRLSRINQSIHSHWLPAHALPVPGE